MRLAILMGVLVLMPAPAYLPEVRFDPPEVEVVEIEGAMVIESWRAPELPETYLIL